MSVYELAVGDEPFGFRAECGVAYCILSPDEALGLIPDELRRDADALEAMVNTLISRDFANVSQSWELTGVYRTRTGTRLRVRIRRNAYNEQSFGKVEVWTPAGWSQVHYLSHPQLEVCAHTGPEWGQVLVSYTEKPLSQAGVEAFAADEASLLTVALQVLGER